MRAGDVTEPEHDGPEKLPAGTLVAFRYRLGERLGMRDEAEIYRAAEDAGATGVVVKLVRPAASGAEGGLRAMRLAEQAENLRKLTHPGIVRLVADGWDEPLGARFLVLELLRGETLEALVTRRRRLEPSEALGWLDALCEVVLVQHAAGMLQLDLSPETVFLPPDGQPFPLRLAEAGRFRRDDPPAPPPRHGVLPYAAPERLRGEACDERSDVHVLGGLSYRMLSGHVPFRGATTAEVLAARSRGVAPLYAAGGSPTEVVVDRTVRRCLADDPAGRFASVAELRAAVVDLRARISRH
ncbi:MAG: serine/threonine protein kinase [Deltaproteobacteria bacterium]|nr:serine/threonine protein kinase [Deltaproteobacteria bacterium]